jgi:hypothetical protein
LRASSPATVDREFGQLRPSLDPLRSAVDSQSLRQQHRLTTRWSNVVAKSACLTLASMSPPSKRMDAPFLSLLTHGLVPSGLLGVVVTAAWAVPKV